MGTGVRNDYPGKGHRSDLEAGFGTRRRLPRGAEVCAALHELSSRSSRRRRRDSGRSHRRSCGVYAGRPTQPSLQTTRPAAFSAGSATLNACTIIDVRSSQHRNARSRLRPMSTAFAPHRRAASRECNSVQRTELQTVAPRRADERTVGNLVPRVAGNEVGLRRAVLQRLRAGRARGPSPARHTACPVIHRVLPRPPEKSWKCGQFRGRKMRKIRVGDACTDPSRPVDSLLHRARSASRSKPLPRAVGGSRRFTGKVDESATGSVNFCVDR